MEFGEAEAKKHGYSELRLATHILLTDNISLYVHLGWSEKDRDEYRVYMRNVSKNFESDPSYGDAIHDG